jgi:hypothetical protein
MGTPSPQSVFDENKVEYIDKETVRKREGRREREEGRTSGKKGEGRKNDIQVVEAEFIANYADGKGYMKYGSTAARYYRPGHIVAKGVYPYSDTLKFSYKNAGTAVASSGDLAYAYGYVEVPGKTGNYLRIWKKDVGNWRIVLDAATY